MPRVQAVNPANATGRAKELLDGVQRAFGMTPNLMRTMANQPAVLDAYLKFNQALSHGGLDSRTREAIALATAGANACDYCSSAHVAISKGMKVDPGEIRAHLTARSSDPKLQALLEFSRAVVSKRGEVDDNDIAAVRAAGYDDGAIVEAVTNVVGNILTNYLNHVARTEIDFPVVGSNGASI